MDDFTFNFTVWDGTDIQVHSENHNVPAKALKVIEGGGSIEFFDPYVGGRDVYIVASMVTSKGFAVCLTTFADLFSGLEPTFVASRLEYCFKGLWTAYKLMGPNAPLEYLSDPNYLKELYLKEISLDKFCEEVLA